MYIYGASNVEESMSLSFTTLHILVALMPLHKKCASYIIRVYTMIYPTEPKSVVHIYYIQ